MLDAVQIVLLGPRCKLTTLECKALFNRNFALRYHVLFNFLTLRNVLGGGNFELPKFADVVEWASGVEEGLWKRLRHIRDDSVEVQMAPSNVANVRDAAWSAEYEVEMDNGFQTLWGEDRHMQVDFDASAVFEHNALGIQTSVLAEAESLLSGVKDETEMLDETDGAANAEHGQPPTKTKSGREVIPASVFTCFDGSRPYRMYSSTAGAHLSPCAYRGSCVLWICRCFCRFGADFHHCRLHGDLSSLM